MAQSKRALSRALEDWGGWALTTGWIGTGEGGDAGVMGSYCEGLQWGDLRVDWEIGR